ncbi:hypothetical protein AALP_AAs73382U000100 [Arabis alpina]|uniref:Uncharacterized protein n=1 Tax=Arabis alpina TaxID=50452 RepID=A0A087FYN7_ARAAL|nr:hypothetical protein AALP_AAs73382U000100 [Arabis alpina]
MMAHSLYSDAPLCSSSDKISVSISCPHGTDLFSVQNRRSTAPTSTIHLITLVSSAVHHHIAISGISIDSCSLTAAVTTNPKKLGSASSFSLLRWETRSTMCALEMHPTVNSSSSTTSTTTCVHRFGNGREWRRLQLYKWVGFLWPICLVYQLGHKDYMFTKSNGPMNIALSIINRRSKSKSPLLAEKSDPSFPLGKRFVPHSSHSGERSIPSSSLLGERTLQFFFFCEKKTVLPCSFSLKGGLPPYLISGNFFNYFTNLLSCVVALFKAREDTIEFVVPTNFGGESCYSTSFVTRFQKSGLAVIILSTHLIFVSNSLSYSFRYLYALIYVAFMVYCTHQRG